jgi:hypothetical protein
MPGSIAEFFTI